MRLEALLNRLANRVDEQERADFLEFHRRTWTRLGLPFTAEDQADGDAYWRWSRTLPADIAFEEALCRAAHWWADRPRRSAENILANAERSIAEHTAGECPEDCPICG
jgi:hypothetical protein